MTDSDPQRYVEELEARLAQQNENERRLLAALQVLAVPLECTAGLARYLLARTGLSASLFDELKERALLRPNGSFWIPAVPPSAPADGTTRELVLIAHRLLASGAEDVGAAELPRYLRSAAGRAFHEIRVDRSNGLTTDFVSTYRTIITAAVERRDWEEVATACGVVADELAPSSSEEAPSAAVEGGLLAILQYAAERAAAANERSARTVSRAVETRPVMTQRTSREEDGALATTVFMIIVALIGVVLPVNWLADDRRDLGIFGLIFASLWGVTIAGLALFLRSRRRRFRPSLSSSQQSLHRRA